MPLLRKKPFYPVNTEAVIHLADDDEVFFCSLTGEIFTQYEEYCERIILVNSMVWSCEYTGKTNLTYAEALESEKRVRRLLQDFPLELRVPIIYLASITKRCLYTEMVEDVFLFVRDKYFIGETVEACTGKDNWCEAHVLSVIRSSESRTSQSMSPNKCCMLYNYEVELYSDDGSGNINSEIIIVPGDKIRRPRSMYTREKNKLFLKQFVEHGTGGLVKIKQNAIDKYNIEKVKFDKIFIGSPPTFPSSKKFEKLLSSMNNIKKFSPDRKVRQESIAKYMTKSDKFEGTKQSKSMEINKGDGKSLTLDMQRIREDKKQKKIEEKMKKKEKSLRFAAYVKEWNKQKEDLELVDHKPLPSSVPVALAGIPNKYFGDIMVIMEFINDFSKTIKMRDFFPSGFDMDMLCRALNVKEVAGPLTDLIQMFLNAVFMLQEGEAEEYNGMKIPNVNPADMEEDEEERMTSYRGVLLATAAAQWPQMYLSSSLTSLPMDSQTFTEVLRLHLLSSGSDANERCLKWRYQQRGGYNCIDDPGLVLRIKKPKIIKALATKHVTQLPISYKIHLINCLMNQILTYASVRDQVEEKIEKVRDIKNRIKSLQVDERKRETMFAITRAKIKKDANRQKLQENLKGEKALALDIETKAKVEALVKEAEEKKADYEKKVKILQTEHFNHQNFVGYDRAYRRYWLYETVPGLFIEHNNKFSGTCLSKPVIPDPTLATAQPEDALNYVQRLFESEMGGNSDKENDVDEGSNKRSLLMSPKKPLADSNLTLIQNLLMCTTNEENCPVHSPNLPEVHWSVMYKPEHIDALIDSLNKRGIREGELRQTMELEKDDIISYISRCPISSLNPIEAPPPNKPDVQTRFAKRYAEANLRFPAGTDINEVLEMTLRDALVDMEEKVYLGCLGELHVKDRIAWSETILKRDYDKQCLKLTWGPNRSISDDLQIINGNTKPDEFDPMTYKDPGHYLAKDGKEVYADSDSDSEVEDEKETLDLSVVRSLASALLQLGQAIHTKFLKRPLGFDEKERQKDPKIMADLTALKKWELSLMECTSFAQVTLHLAILDNSILWSKSVLNANCRICRRRNDPENMLLCDSCNKGHHLYCLKPKLTKIPEGDWFCLQCKPKEKTPQKKKNRKVFNDASESENEDNDKENNEDEDEDDDDDDESKSWNDSEVCQICTSGGALIHCTSCSQGYHSECLGKTPRRNAFVCSNCVGKPKKQQRESVSSDEYDEKPARKRPNKLREKPKVSNSRKAAPTLNGDLDVSLEIRRCAADAMLKPNHYSKMLNQTFSDSSDSEMSDNHTLASLKSKRKRTSKENLVTNGLTNGHAGVKKSNRISDENYKSKRNSQQETNGLSNGFTRKSRRSETLHKSQLEELINETLRHRDSWPFSKPVTLDLVPDYFDIIEKPMDFGTIKTKLESGKYTTDSQVMADSLLVFDNCVQYNQDDDPVAKAGARLKKFFEKKCKDLCLVGFDEETNAPDLKKFKHC